MKYLSNLRSLSNGSAKSAKSLLDPPFDTFDTGGGKDIQNSTVDNSVPAQPNSEIQIPPTGELPKVSKAIWEACDGVIDPEVFRANLTPEDLADIEAARVSVEYLRCAAESMSRRK